MAPSGSRRAMRAVRAQSRHRHALDEAGAERIGLAVEGLGGAERDRPRRRGGRRCRPGSARRSAGTSRLQLGAVDQLLVREAAQAQLVDARAEAVELLLGLGDQHLAVARSRNRRPRGRRCAARSPSRHGQRDLGDVPGQLAHAAGVDARGVAAGVILLEHDPSRRAAPVQRGGAAVDAAADDDDVGGAGSLATDRRTAASVLRQVRRARPASSASRAGAGGSSRPPRATRRAPPRSARSPWPAQPALARPHAAAQERLHLVGALQPSVTRVADLAGGDLLAAAHDRVGVLGREERRRGPVEDVEEASAAHRLRERARTGAARRSRSPLVDAADAGARPQGRDLAAQGGALGPADARAVAGDRQCPARWPRTSRPASASSNAAARPRPARSRRRSSY